MSRDEKRLDAAHSGPGSSVDASGSQGVLIGDNALQVNYFAHSPAGPKWPIVVGNPPSVATAYQERSALMAELKSALNSNRTAIVTQVMSGDGGVGKTQLAASVFHNAFTAKMADLSIWITATSRQAVVSQYAEALSRLQLTAPVNDPELSARALLTWLRETEHPWLVVLDDLSDPGDLNGLWPVGPNGRTLVTTRRRDAVLSESNRICIDVGVFEPEESGRYLNMRLPRAHAPAEDLAEREALASDLGHLPLALAQASAVILDGGWACGEYRRRFRDRTHTLVDLFPNAVEDYRQRTVAATWSLATESANRLVPAGVSAHLLNLTAFLSPNGIPEKILTAARAQDYVREEFQAESAPPLSAENLRTAIRNLHRLSIVTHDTAEKFRPVRIHALAQRATRECLSGEARLNATRAAARALLSVWPSVERDADLSEILRQNARALEYTAGNDLWLDESYLALFRSGESLGEMGLVREALSYWQKIHQTANSLLGPEHSSTLLARENIALWRGRSGNASGATAALSELLADRRRILGPDHPDTLSTRNTLAYWTGRTGNAHGAVEALTALLPALLRVLGRDNPMTLATRSNLAYWRGRAGDPSGARLAFAQIVADRERVLGSDHIDTLSARHSAAYWQGPAGDPQGARDALRHVLDDRMRVLGPHHPDTLTTRHELARWVGRSGEPAAAAAAFDELLTDRLRILGPDHPDTLAARGNLGLWTGEAGDPHTAMTTFEKLVADRIRVQGPDHPETLTSRHHLACWRGKAGNAPAAVQGLDMLLPARLRVQGPNHPDTLTTRHELGCWQARLGDIATGIAQLESVLVDRLRVLGPEHPDTHVTHRELAALRQLLGDR
ncbi:tetratricopeptide repeat protein [Streptosporangium sp. NBC_01469]|uniref:tetratricopeptide repeat protein n=1 Tax=Streptosporangium sp. NBC_01469 TaxID=2903898 RepID=UPI002E2CC5EF|nr:tetratricopeptide repeat protein [Streptosporangium sp. NBC_01469]